LLVSAGHQLDLYGRRTPQQRPESPHLPSTDVIGLSPSADELEKSMHAARKLLESGVRRICVSLQDSIAIRAAKFPSSAQLTSSIPIISYGSVPVLAGSDISNPPKTARAPTPRSSIPTRTAR